MAVKDIPDRLGNDRKPVGFGQESAGALGQQIFNGAFVDKAA